MIEVEYKGRLTPEMLNTVHYKLQTSSAPKTIQNTDIYYDTANWDLLRQAVFVRIRNQHVLEFKFNEHKDRSHIQSTEHTFFLADMNASWNNLFTSFLPDWQPASTIEEAIARNALSPLATIRNTRQIYTYQAMKISIDHVEELGDFLEIEIQCESTAELPLAHQRISSFLEDLPFQRLKVGYVELWLQKFNHKAYEVGHYQ
uniref:CYTH domain-containing protein n=1 Tax=Thermosporothrix sp. COM3 TaxID=2490863 RepID=A0A455SLG8_9CHLR|nr:hypothetical protein KTC_17760 [Thermosporothrix sp. COM3]